MNLNVLVRGQSNVMRMMEDNGGAGVPNLAQEVARLLGFDGANDTVSIIYDAGDWQSSTAFGGTALLGDWLYGSPGNWTVGGLEQALLNEIGALPSSQRDDPTATLWFHSEFDSRPSDLAPETWVSAVRFDADQVRAALGQDAATTPYLFVSAMPYNKGSDQGHQAIREGMEILAADPGFNAHIAARILDIDADDDDTDFNPATNDYGGEHIDAGDSALVIARAGRAIAEAFAAHAKPGSPVAQAGGNIADEGPEVIRAELVGSNQLLLDVQHDQASGFSSLDPDAAAGIGWQVFGATTSVIGTAVQLVDADTLRVTFSGDLPQGGALFYGYGYGRLGGSDAAGRGNAIYDNHGLPIWVRAEGLAIDGLGTGPVDPSPNTPISLTVGSGPDTLVLRIAQDEFLGPAEYVVRVDGQQIGGTLA
ncbi:hypothetical protein, partial [Falsiroseomonas sp.]|uniref:hypothetical protein n=1 Tax=Falsiroseomonas sp. TaxID=2870721 RepID=UPI0035644C0D